MESKGNAMIDEFTICGSCYKVKSVCFVRTFECVGGAMRMVRLCQDCLDSMSLSLQVFSSPKAADKASAGGENGV